ncbi:MAG: hypothetical protein K9J12_05800 [Melioribacteraceae bacterium]|nr:hypothetical protein [Melioribacteraceae bacterium]MCF8264957.1 hypothetical protein [Melioribacteraceae bacterium]MCF8431973.1 hypothetical protein [Melioribacteraceae bacterium]
MKRLFILFIFISSLIIAQVPSNVSDTVKAVSLKEFKVPSDKNIVLQDVLSASFAGTLLDANGSVVRESSNGVQIPSADELVKLTRGGRGTTVQYSLLETIPNPGTYYMKIDINFRSETGSRSATAYYMVIVDYPTIAAPLEFSDSYLFTEQLKFSFATIEYGDPTLYTFDVQDASGSSIESGEGPIVDMATAFSQEKNVDRSIRVVGMYNGQEFQFKNPVDGTVQSSTWEFLLKAPQMSMFHVWIDPDNNPNNAENSIFYLNDKAMLLYVALMQPNAKGAYIAVGPKIRGLQVQSTSPIITGGRPIESDPFSFIQLDVDNDYVENIMESPGSEFVQLTITFTDQFNRRHTQSLEAYVIN